MIYLAGEMSSNFLVGRQYLGKSCENLDNTTVRHPHHSPLAQYRMPPESDVEGLGLYVSNYHPKIYFTSSNSAMKFIAHCVSDYRAPVAVMDSYNLRFGAL